MKMPDIIVIQGRAYSWRALQEARRAQITAWKKAQPVQPALFHLKDDRRPESERSTAGRYHEPSLLVYLQDVAE